MDREFVSPDAIGEARMISDFGRDFRRRVAREISRLDLFPLEENHQDLPRRLNQTNRLEAPEILLSQRVDGG
jgi:hypothetical protein